MKDYIIKLFFHYLALKTINYNYNMIKNKFLFILIAAIFINCTGANSGGSDLLEMQASNTQKAILKQTENAYLQFADNRFDFGKLSRKKHPDFTIDVEFSNIGDKPLVILKADVSCGCLSVEYPKAPLMPNQSAKMTIHVDTRAQKGVFNKTIFIKTNAENDVELIRLIGTIHK